MLRVATAADAPGIARVHVATWRATYRGIVPDSTLDALTVPAAASRWERRLGERTTRAWVAERGGEVAAFASAGPARDDDVDAMWGEVYSLYVRPDAQGAGTGAALLAAATAWLDRAAVLWTFRGNAPARAFYEHAGWTPDGTERPIDIDGVPIPEVRYCLPQPGGGSRVDVAWGG